MAGGTKVIGSVIGMAVENRDNLKKVAAPVATTAVGAGKVIWGTIWKTFLAQVALFTLWVGTFMFTFVTTGSYMMVQSNVTILLGFFMFILTPAVVLFTQVRKVVKQTREDRDRMRAQVEEQKARIIAERELRSQFQQAPVQSTDYADQGFIVVSEQPQVQQ